MEVGTMETIGIDLECISIVSERDSVYIAKFIGAWWEDFIIKISKPIKDVSSWETWDFVRVGKSSNTLLKCSYCSFSKMREVAEKMRRANVLTFEIGIGVKTIEN